MEQSQVLSGAFSGVVLWYFILSIAPASFSSLFKYFFELILVVMHVFVLVLVVV